MCEELCVRKWIVTPAWRRMEGDRARRQEDVRRLGHSQLREGDFPGCTVDKNLPAHPGDTGSIPGPGRCLGATKAYELQRLQKLHLLQPARPGARAPQ